jgi:hypothetical protein
MRLLYVCSVLIFFVLPSHAQQQQKAAKNQNNVAVPSPKSTTVPAPAVAPSVGNVPAVIQQTCSQEKANDWPQILTGVGLIIVGAYGVGVAMRTLNKIGIQADAAMVSANAAKDAADSAKKSADALINSERAWVDIELTNEAADKYTFKAVNHGKTPAIIVSAKIETIGAEKSMGDAALKAINELVSKEAPKNLYEIDIRTERVTSGNNTATGQKKLVYRGSVEYRTVTDRPSDLVHCSTFVYRYNFTTSGFEKIATQTTYT